MNSSGVLAIDVGGTKISGAIIDSNFKILVQKTIPSRASIKGIADPELSNTKGLILDLCAFAKANAVELKRGGAGFPEYVNLQGILTTADNIDWREQPQQDFARLTGFPWVVQSDVRCAGIAEAKYGAGRGLVDFVYVTISSGISHTHFLHGSAVAGSNGEAIGFGLIEVEVDGNKVVLEKYCSGLGIARRYAHGSQDFSFDAKSLMERFEIDVDAREVITSAAEVLGTELAKLAQELDTEVIVIGGGLWLGSAKYRQLVLQTFSSARDSLNLHPAIRSAEVQRSGVIGAAVYAFAALESTKI